MKNIAAYARVSTKKEEQESSIIYQSAHFQALIEKDKNAVFVSIYADKKSGKNTRQRPQFNEMLKAARRGEIDYIYTKSISRFARNLVETLKIVRELREIGVGVYFDNENIDTLDSTSDFMLSIYSIVAEGELENMSENVKIMARKRFASGSVELSKIFGYDLKNKKLTPNPAEAAVVREVFERYADGDGHDKIARIMNNRGVFRQQGKWTATNVKLILRNEKYTGDAILQKTYTENLKKRKNNGEIPQYYVENNHEAIVSRELYEKVQALREQKLLKPSHGEFRDAPEVHPGQASAPDMHVLLS